MPGGDRSGPAGFGPRSGRATGFCAGYDVPGYMNSMHRGGGFGHGWGGCRWGRQFRGAGYGLRRWGGEYHGPEREADLLRHYADSLEKELEQIREEIQSLQGRQEQEKKSD